MMKHYGALNESEKNVYVWWCAREILNPNSLKKIYITSPNFLVLVL